MFALPFDLVSCFARLPNFSIFKAKIAQPQPLSEISRILWRFIKMVVPTIDILDRTRQFVVIGIVKRSNRNRVEDTAQGLLFPLREGADAAGRAEAVMQVGVRFSRRRPLIIRQRVCARDQSKVFGLHNREPARALVQIEQLHLVVPLLRSMSASKRAALQWQLP
jgi:hypothetical protein